MSKNISKDLYDDEVYRSKQYYNDLLTDEDKYAAFLMLCQWWSAFTTKSEIDGNEGITYDYYENYVKKNDVIDYDSIPGFSWDNTISFYELLCWFNQHYNEFIKEARELPQLEATFRDKDTAEIVTRKFVFDSVPKDNLGMTPLMFFHEDYDKHKSWGNPTKRELIFSGSLVDERIAVVDQNNFTEYSSTFNRFYNCEIDDDIYKAYIDLRNKYYDFLRVYTILKNYNIGLRKIIYATYIDAPNPFKKINSFKLFLAGPSNEAAYMCTYKLGSKYPIFCGNNMTSGGYLSNKVDKPYDYVPKMTRIRRDRFDVDIDLSDIEFPELREFDKQYVYIPKK